MALKDWKKWENKNKQIIVFAKLDDTQKAIGISYVPEYHIWQVKYSLNKEPKEFKSKAQALKFAKAYMRSH